LKPNSKSDSNPDLPDFEEESFKLIQEMRSNQKEERLIKIKSLDLKPASGDQASKRYEKTS
jgi:hypothetical protein